MIFTQKYKQIVKDITELRMLNEKSEELYKLNQEIENVIDHRVHLLNNLQEEASSGFKTASRLLATFETYRGESIANYLKDKKRPAKKASEEVRASNREKREALKKMKIAQNFVEYYETLFPWLREYVGHDLNELLDSLSKEKEIEEENDDPVLIYIARDEYKKLKPSIRNQKALDRYRQSRKFPHVIGRDYERYVGYLYEKDGYDVEYTGIEQGLEDMGRDLICRKGDKIEVVQCKCWAKHKTIHEKHINQLYGTTIKHYLEMNESSTKSNELLLFHDLLKEKALEATFFTSTSLSDKAIKFANALGVKVLQNKELGEYPMIKCNISKSGEKIYHLPFDQQYDKTKVYRNGGFYALTVKQAEDNGFRRAYKWRGVQGS